MGILARGKRREINRYVFFFLTVKSVGRRICLGININARTIHTSAITDRTLYPDVYCTVLTILTGEELSAWTSINGKTMRTPSLEGGDPLLTCNGKTGN